MQVALLGRQPKLSVAELESLFGAEKIQLVSEYVALVDSSKPLPQERLGGTMKSATVLKKLTATDAAGAFTYLQTAILEDIAYLPKGKLQLGVSIYGFKAQRDWLLKQMLTLKKAVKKTGQSVRIIENKSEALEAAQVLYNKLTSELGREYLFIKDGTDVLIAQTTGVQNIDDYSKRDFDRPKRDAFVGMLPPKLAQIMINLAQPKNGATVLDPFCGTGVVLQEALLMGYGAYGTDLSEKMIDYSQQNIAWIKQISGATLPTRITQGDATSFTWEQPFESVACETYLGTPLTSLPARQKLDPIMSEANTIAEGFLRNIAPQLKKGTHLCVALPAWHLGNNSFAHLKVLDHLTDLGYNRLDLVHAKKTDLIYHRENQVVARELTILEKQ